MWALIPAGNIEPVAVHLIATIAASVLAVDSKALLLAAPAHPMILE
jgi:hypothetical protein